MNYKKITLDTERKSFESIIAMQGDNKSRYIDATIVNKSIPINLTGCTVKFSAIKPDITDIFNDVSITNPTAGKVKIELTNQTLAVPGVVQATLVILKEDMQLSVLPFFITVIENPYSPNAIESKSEYKALNNALTIVNVYAKELQDASVNLEEKYTTRLNNFDEQLDKNTSNINAKYTELNTKINEVAESGTTDEVIQNKVQELNDKGVLAVSDKNFIALTCNSKIPNIEFSLSSRKLTLYSGTTLITGNLRYQLTSDLIIDLDITKTVNYIFYSFSKNEILIKNKYNSLSTVTTDYKLLCMLSFSANGSLLNCTISGEFNVNENRFRENIIKEINLEDNSASYSKRTKLGEKLHLNLGSPYKLPNIDTVNCKLQFFGITSLYYGKSRKILGSNYSDVYEIDFSEVWNNAGESPHIYYNPFNDEFNIYKSSNTSRLENDVFLCVIHKHGDSKNVVGVTGIFDYTIDGVKPIDKAIDEFSSNINLNNSRSTLNFSDLGWYKAPVCKGYDAVGHAKDNITLNDIYGIYDEMVSNNSNYVTRTLLGKDASNTYDIYSYKFTPPILEGSDIKGKTIPKIIIITNTHGEEKAGTISLMNFMEDVCNRWREDKILEFVRWNIELIIVPIVNPYGFSRSKKTNYNGVDLNRNYDYNWGNQGSADPTNEFYRGTEPFSEVETQYIRDILLNNLDAIAHFDYHMNGNSGESYNDLCWMVLKTFKDKAYEFKSLAKHVIFKHTNESQKSYQIPEDSGFVGYLSTANPSTSTSYAYSQGIPSITIECARKVFGENVVYSSRINQINTEYIGNIIYLTAHYLFD